ncbi:tRNA lysidine(34) synthetase TilS [Nitratireductor alexandrii]|uniref:tRNA lysidine(34) synthetase TilS n=1 Tax=Nitratireductor alexandrii TaxID=2448161 RepID=UPI000FDA85C0|nr:tRNA lysidine(34) synthetase TilS [Nitratireductor alexandrii]
MLSTPAADPPPLFSDLVLPATGPVIVAVSGGGDSLALLVLLNDHFSRYARERTILAVTVDHGLRPDAAREARHVGAVCAQLGIAHRILSWQGAKPDTGLMAAARQARYDLLFRAAQESGAAMIMTAHTRDDQAETVFMRRARGAGRGLAGIAPATLVRGRVWTVRPLLDMSRAALRDVLRMRGLAWVEDPSNQDCTYERVRARACLAADPGLTGALVAAGRAAREKRVALGLRAAAIVRACARMPAPGLVRLGRDLVDTDDTAAAGLAISALVAAVGGRARLVEDGRAEKLLARLAQASVRTTLAGAVVDVRKAGIFLYRELRAGWTGTVPARAGTLWDRRYRIVATPASAVAVEARGRGRSGEALGADADCPAALRRAGLAGEPVFVNEKGRAIADDAGGFAPVVAPFACYLPAFDFELAAALGAVFGCPAPPASPLRGHNAA